VKLTHGDGHQTLVLWARTDVAAQIEISATSEKAQLLDQYGNIILARPVDSVYRLLLPGARCNSVDGCAVGGSVFLLIQPVGDGIVREITSAGEVDLTFE